MICVFDLDNTLCRTSGTDYLNAVPIPEMIDYLNSLYDRGHFIIIYTGRSITHSSLTKAQLKKWKVHYHQLKFNKIKYDVWIDDKAINPQILMQSRTSKNL